MCENETKTAPVCFFDSGIGGLNLMAGFRRRHKNVNICYFADNYNVPYGNLTHAQILKIVEEKFGLMSTLRPGAAVIACNTVTAECIEVLRNKFGFPIVGIQPAVKPAAAVAQKCVVLATPVTAQSSSLKKLVELYGKGRTKIVPCPNLAAYIEDNIFNMDARVLERMLPAEDCDAVVLGCTHYIYASEIISSFYKSRIFDGVEGTLNNLDKILGICDHNGKTEGEITFYGGNVKKNYKIFSLLNT